MIIQLIDVASKQNAMPRKVCKQQCKVLAHNKKTQASRIATLVRFLWLSRKTSG